MIYSLGELGVEIDLGHNAPGAILQRARRVSSASDQTRTGQGNISKSATHWLHLLMLEAALS
jgi:hypothetical protein